MNPATVVLPQLPGQGAAPPCGQAATGPYSSSVYRGPFLFTEQPSQFGAQIGTGDPSLREGSTARAAGGGRAVSAKSLSQPFVHVDHITHWGGSLCCSARQPSTGAFA